MNDPGALHEAIETLIESYGVDSVSRSFNKILSRTEAICTVVVNAGLHKFPESILLGDVYIFTEGNLHLENSDIFHQELSDHLVKLADYISNRKWKKIYLVISGHAVLNMNVKLLIYRLTRLETVDWVYDGQGSYFECHIPVRSILGTKHK